MFDEGLLILRMILYLNIFLVLILQSKKVRKQTREMPEGGSCVHSNM